MEEIAKKVGKTREHLSRVRKDPDANVQKLAAMIADRYKEVLKEEEHRILDTDKIRALDAAVSVLIAEVASLKSERTGEPVQSIIMKLQKSSKDVAKSL